MTSASGFLHLQIKFPCSSYLLAEQVSSLFIAIPNADRLKSLQPDGQNARNRFIPSAMKKAFGNNSFLSFRKLLKIMILGAVIFALVHLKPVLGATVDDEKVLQGKDSKNLPLEERIQSITEDGASSPGNFTIGKEHGYVDSNLTSIVHYRSGEFPELIQDMKQIIQELEKEIKTEMAESSEYKRYYEVAIESISVALTNLGKALELQSTNDLLELWNRLVSAVTEDLIAIRALLEAVREAEINSSSDPMQLYLAEGKVLIQITEGEAILSKVRQKEIEEWVERSDLERWDEAIERNSQAIDYYKKSLEAKKNYQLLEGNLWELAGISMRVSSLNLQCDIYRVVFPFAQDNNYQTTSDRNYRSSKAYQEAAIVSRIIQSEKKMSIDVGGFHRSIFADDFLSIRLISTDKVDHESVTILIIKCWNTAAQAFDKLGPDFRFSNDWLVEAEHWQSLARSLSKVFFDMDTSRPIDSLAANQEIWRDNIVSDRDLQQVKQTREVVNLILRSLILRDNLDLPFRQHAINIIRLVTEQLLHYLQMEEKMFQSPDPTNITFIETGRSMARHFYQQTEHLLLKGDLNQLTHLEEAFLAEINHLRNYEEQLFAKYGTDQGVNRLIPFVLQTMQNWHANLTMYPVQLKLDSLRSKEATFRYNEFSAILYRDAISCLEEAAQTLHSQASKWFQYLALIVASEKYEEAVLTFSGVINNRALSYSNRKMIETQSQLLYMEAGAINALAYNSD